MSTTRRTPARQQPAADETAAASGATRAGTPNRAGKKEDGAPALRVMRWWDIEAVMRLENELFAEDAWSDAMFWSELAQQDTRHYLVATDGDKLVGYAGLCAYAEDQAYVQTIAVDPRHQRRGIGTTMLEALIDESEGRHCTQLDLEVRADNDGAIALYERHGFRRIGLRRRYYQPSGTDAVVMRRKQR